MEITAAKEQVIKAGKRLVEQGLISRTWGNVSCRIDDKSFVITPSGKPYETLTPEQIVQVNIDSLEYTGNVKPSSEKGVHAAVYKARPEINFVIHTHQKLASVFSALGGEIRYVPQAFTAITGKKIPYAKYGLPGTKTLIEGVAAALARTKSKAVLMAHHGALCFGEDSDTAFEAALSLEKICEEHIFTHFKKIYGSEISDIPQFARKMFENDPRAKGIDLEDSTGFVSFRKEGNFVLTRSDDSEKPLIVCVSTGKPVNNEKMTPEGQLHRAVYLKRADINYIIHSRQSDLLAVSCLCETVKPQVDDFAQIVGADMRCAEFDEKNAEKTAVHCVKAMNGRHAVLLKGKGALCCGVDESDARAVEMIAEKNCLTFLGTMLFNVYQPITPLHSHLMRFIYLKKYSKQAV